MKTLLLRTVVFCFAIGSLVALSSCGGGGGSSNPSGASGSSGGGTTGTTGATTPNSILSGKYAFSFTGTTTSAARLSSWLAASPRTAPATLPPA